MTRLPTLATAAFGAAFALVSVAPAPARAQADDPAFVTVAGGWFDMNRRKDEAAEFRLEYRHDQKFWVFKPFAGAMGTSGGATYYYAGILMDVYFGKRIVMTPSFAPGYYAKGSGYDVTVLRQVIRLRKMDKTDRAEQEAVLDTYLRALEM